MAQTGENVRCLVLGEFVDDASVRLQAVKAAEEQANAESLHDLPRREERAEGDGLAG